MNTLGVCIMFNSLASYILGNGNRNATDITQDGQQISGASDEAINNFKFVTTSCEDEDEEWLLVEKGGIINQFTKL